MWGMLPVNSVGGAEGRGQNQAPSSVVSPELTFSLRWCCLLVGCQWEAVPRTRLRTHWMPLPLWQSHVCTEMLTILASKGRMTHSVQQGKKSSHFVLFSLFISKPLLGRAWLFFWKQSKNIPHPKPMFPKCLEVIYRELTMSVVPKITQNSKSSGITIKLIWRIHLILFTCL